LFAAAQEIRKSLLAGGGGESYSSREYAKRASMKGIYAIREGGKNRRSGNSDFLGNFRELYYLYACRQKESLLKAQG